MDDHTKSAGMATPGDRADFARRLIIYARELDPDLGRSATPKELRSMVVELRCIASALAEGVPDLQFATLWELWSEIHARIEAGALLFEIPTMDAADKEVQAGFWTKGSPRHSLGIAVDFISQQLGRHPPLWVRKQAEDQAKDEGDG